MHIQILPLVERGIISHHTLHYGSILLDYSLPALGLYIQVQPIKSTVKRRTPLDPGYLVASLIPPSRNARPPWWRTDFTPCLHSNAFSHLEGDKNLSLPYSSSSPKSIACLNHSVYQNRLLRFASPPKPIVLRLQLLYQPQALFIRHSIHTAL